MSRLTPSDRSVLLAKYVELELANQGTAHFLHCWAKKEGKELLSRVPSRCACIGLISKFARIGNIADSISDLPRDQTKKTGKTAAISKQTKRMVVRKAKDADRPRHKRRAKVLATETHAGRQICESSIRNILHEKHMRFRRSRETIALKPHHIGFRLKMAEKWAEKDQTFWREFIFSDEKIFRMCRNRHSQNDGIWTGDDIVSEADAAVLTHVVDRHSASVMVWVGLSYYGKLDIHFVQSTNTSQHYSKNIVRGIVKPFMAKHRDVKVFQQDGATIHTSDFAQKFLDQELGAGNWTSAPPTPCKKRNLAGNFETRQITTKTGQTRNLKVDNDRCDCQVPFNFVHPAKSPDLNIVENAWTHMTRELDKLPNSKTEADFKVQIAQVYASMPMDYVRKLFDSIPSRFEAILEAKGKMTRY